ncbi:MAG: carbon-nitrogen hydrolase family protein [Capsulimonadaceae bacterium]|nr:carbon-nitrogen hydrolase family protein [Capsulimonadaceae bacterium]
MNTRARIATVCQAERFFPTVEQNRDFVLGTLELALLQKPDLVCLPESFTTVTHPGDASARAENVPGPTTDRVCALAKRHGSYVICPIITRRDGHIFNSAIMIDRKGQIAGIYDKRRPVATGHEYTILDRGCEPGLGDGIFDLDFGRIGIRICFDVGFPDDWALLASKGARLVFWPSAYHGGPRFNAYALLNRYYVVTSVRTAHSRIIDPCGTTLAQTDNIVNVVVRDINLDFAVCHYDYNNGIPDKILADYPGRVEIRSDPDSVNFFVEPVDPSVTIATLQEKYAFETADQYHERHMEAYASYARGEKPIRQNAPHGNRAMWSK